MWMNFVYSTLIHTNYSEADSNLQLTFNFFGVSVGDVCPLGIDYPRSIHLYFLKCWILYYICYSLFLNVYFMFHVLVSLTVTCGNPCQYFVYVFQILLMCLFPQGFSLSYFVRTLHCSCAEMVYVIVCMLTPL